MKQVSALVALFALAAPALAQGSDSCATPQVISGNGPFAFDDTSATTGLQGQPVCGVRCTFDVWFTWTAPTTDSYVVSDCSGASIDSLIGVYDGNACPTAPALGCNDDSCGVQSAVAFSAVQGSSYTIQIGTYNGSPGGTGTFTIAIGVPCSAVTGPDVIVGDINGVQNYTGAGGLDAISLGTTSCNLGNVWVNWIAGINQHPVIGGNLYRYHVVDGAGRFEQIGLSWLKHGFYALSELLCCPTCIATDGTHLGVGCSDPYTADRNGTQSVLGPRFQVDAHTGAFVYPPANPSYSGPTARRCQFLASDVDTSAGNRYFGECQYVCPDDALAGNNNNNASWRELTASGSNPDYAFQLNGPTTRAQGAIQAWALCESGVSVVDTQIPGEGLFDVAYKTTNLGSGQYHYEIAVHNLNSDRSGGSFSIPIPVGVVVTNIGFHDVEYRNGDGPGDVNYSGLDWVGNVSGGALTWACEPAATNTNANAVRWGTTYNFRFDANAAPAAGIATLGLWKAGSPGPVTLSMDVPGGTPMFTPFCFGDGTGMACPCANNGSAGHGCQNSLSTGGALLSASGNASLSADSLQFTSSGEMPSALSILVQGDASASPLAFGDGLLCTGGVLSKLYVKTAVAGTIVAPVGSDPSISARSAAKSDTITPGTARIYQAYYRDPNPGFCPTPTGGTFNISGAVLVHWGS